MAFMGEQVAYPVSLVRGTTEVITSYEGRTEADIMRRSYQEYGNTKYTDERIIYCYFKEHFSLTRTSRRIGYAEYIRADGANSNTRALIKRLKALNPQSMLAIASDMTRWGLITLEDLQKILTIRKSRYRTQQGKLYKHFAKRLVMASIAKFGTREKSAKKFGVPIAEINYWADLED